MNRKAVSREIFLGLWKIHILHHAAEGGVVGNWMLEELRHHGYEVSPGTLYPILARMEHFGWLRRHLVHPRCTHHCGRRTFAQPSLAPVSGLGRVPHSP